MCSLLHVNCISIKLLRIKYNLCLKVVRINKSIYIKYKKFDQAPGELSGTHYWVSDSVLGVESTRKNKAD